MNARFMSDSMKDKSKALDETRYPKISIVTPSHNQAPYLEETIISVINQNYPNLEYIIIDGGSTDGSVEIIQKYQEHLAYWVSEPDKGQYNGINKGFLKATGEIMAWINSDDKLVPGALSAVGQIFSTFQDIDWLTSNYQIEWNRYGQAVRCFNTGGFNKTSFFRGRNLPACSWYARSWIQQESTFWRRSLWDLSGAKIDEALNFAGDFDLWARFYRFATLYGVNAFIGGFRIHGDQKTGIGMDLYLEEAKRSLLIENSGSPYGFINSQYRRFANGLFEGKYHLLNRIPSMIIDLLVKFQLIYPVSIVEWKNNTWEIVTRYVF